MGRSGALTVVLAAALGLGACATRPGRIEAAAPPLHPVGETAEAGATRVLAPRCAVALDSLAGPGPGHMRLVRTLVTRSLRWGLVLRADVREGDDAATLGDTRFVCRETPAPGKLVVKLAPLKSFASVTPPLPVGRN